MEEVAGPDVGGVTGVVSRRRVPGKLTMPKRPSSPTANSRVGVQGAAIALTLAVATIVIAVAAVLRLSNLPYNVSGLFVGDAGLVPLTFFALTLPLWTSPRRSMSLRERSGAFSIRPSSTHRSMSSV